MKSAWKNQICHKKSPFFQPRRLINPRSARLPSSVVVSEYYYLSLVHESIWVESTKLRTDTCLITAVWFLIPHEIPFHSHSPIHIGTNMMSQHATINFFIVIFLSLRCHQFAESLAAPCNTVTPSNRVFVAGISHTCTEQTIRSTFSHFGGVENILIIG